MLCDLLVCHAFREALLCAGLPCCAVLCPAVRWSRRVIPNRKDLCGWPGERHHAGCTKYSKVIQFGWHFESIFRTWPIWDDLRAIFGLGECKRTFQGPFLEDLGSKRDPKWDPKIDLGATRSPPGPPKCASEVIFS